MRVELAQFLDRKGQSAITLCVGLVLLFLVFAGQATATEGKSASLPGSTIVTQVALQPDDGGVDIVLDLSHRQEPTVSAMIGPDRILLDFPGARFHAPALKVTPGLAKAVRFGAMMRGQGRIVIELSGPARVAEQRFLPLPGGGHRLVIRLAKADRTTFLMLAAAADDALTTGSVTARAGGTEKPELPLVMLDPGHGGADTGATGPGGELEKTLVLAMAHLVKERLERSGKARVQMTRNTDVFVPLRERVRLARQAKAALFISIHADAVPDEAEVRGASVYVLSERATDESAARLAERENRADLAGGVEAKEENDDVSDILFDLARRESRVFSNHFARGLVGALPKATRLHKNPLRGAGFRVLRAPDVPSVLVELGYLTTPDEAKTMMTDEWRRGVADAISDAVERFLSEKVTTGDARGVRR